MTRLQACLRTIILDWIATHGIAPTIAEIARVAGKPQNTTRAAITRMARRGMLVNDRGGVWVRTVFIIKSKRQRRVRNIFTVEAKGTDMSSNRLELEAAYKAALKLVARIDFNLERGIHYRTRGGCLLTTLDEVVRAILSDDLPPLGDEPAAVPWEQPGELVLARAA